MLKMQSTQDDSSNVTLILKHGKEIRASRNRLLGASDFFFTILNCDMQEKHQGIIRLEHISENAMRNVLEFGRSGSVDIESAKNAKDLIKAADYLLLPRLKAIAGSFFIPKVLLSNCISTYYFAEKYKCDHLMIVCKKFIFTNFASVAQGQEFLSLESHQVKEWICSDEISVCREDDVFRIILKWIKQNKSNRQGKFAKLFHHVRLAFVSRDFLSKGVAANDLVKENSSCLKLVTDSLKGIYHANDIHLQRARKWKETHLVVFTGRHTLCSQPNDDEWYKLSDAPVKYYLWGHPEAFNRDPYQMCVFQGNLYVFPSAICSAPGAMYDPSLNRWTVLSQHGTALAARKKGSATQMIDSRTIMTDVKVIGSKIYALVESASESFREQLRRPFRTFPHSRFCSILKYDIGKSTWNVVVPKVEQIKGGPCAVAMNNYFYVIGGYHGDKTFACYAGRLDTNDNVHVWERVADMKNPRSYASGMAVHGKIFVAGGFVNNKTTEMYNPLTNEWQLIGSLNTPRRGGSMLCLDEMLYVVGGERTSEYSSLHSTAAVTVECYDFNSNKWKQKMKLPKFREVFERRNIVIKACSVAFSKEVFNKGNSSRCQLVSFKIISYSLVVFFFSLIFLLCLWITV